MAATICHTMNFNTIRQSPVAQPRDVTPTTGPYPQGATHLETFRPRYDL